MSAVFAMTPAELSASVEAHEKIRRKATSKAGRNTGEHQQRSASPINTSEEAITGMQPPTHSPLAGFPIVDGLPTGVTLTPLAIDITFPAATTYPYTTGSAPQESLTCADLPRYEPAPETTALIQDIVETHRQRQTNIKAKTKLILQAKALLRTKLCTDADYEDDATKAGEENAFGESFRKLTKKAMARVDDAMKEAEADPMSEYGLMVAPYVGGIALFEARQSTLEKALVKLAKKLPAYEWAKSVKGLGDVSFATLVGECGDIGTYKSIAAVWKRLGLAVMSGNRQGNPGKGASSQDWVDHGYNKQRRSVAWNARQQIIGGMGKWRPEFGEDVRANPLLTEYQCVYAERARVEAAKLDMPVTESDKGKESYKKHVSNRAHRYVEKRMVKHLYLEWRRASAGAA